MKSLYLLVLLLVCGEVTAQNSWGVKMGNHIGYSGYYLHLAPEFRTGSFSIHAGPKLAITETRFPQKGPFGLDAGIRWSPQKNCRLHGLLALNYQYISFKGYKETGKHTALHELQLGTALRWAATKRLEVDGGIYVGRYFERWPGYYMAEPSWNGGFNNMVRLSVNYLLSKE